MGQESLGKILNTEQKGLSNWKLNSDKKGLGYREQAWNGPIFNFEFEFESD